MRVPHVRFTVRRMMVAVAIVAALIWGEQTRRRRSYFRGRATICRTNAAEFARAYTTGQMSIFRTKPSGPRIATTRPLVREWAIYYDRLWKKYERASRYPWEYVPPDPPPPERVTIP